jgi:hypothetical protein
MYKCSCFLRTDGIAKKSSFFSFKALLYNKAFSKRERGKNMEDVAYSAVYPLKEIPRRRITAMSSLNEVSMDPLGEIGCR